MEVELTEVDSSPHERKILLERLPVTIGQSPDAGVRLEDHWVSRQHCELNAVKGTLVVRDLGSMLGTFVNGLNVNRALLMPGDKLTVGITSFLVDYERRHVTRRSAPVASQPADAEPIEPARAETRRGFRRFVSRVFQRTLAPLGRNGRSRASQPGLPDPASAEIRQRPR